MLVKTANPVTTDGAAWSATEMENNQNRTSMAPQDWLPEHLRHMPDRELFLLFSQSCQRTEETQRQVLASIVSAAKHTELGQRYDFASIQSVQDYQTKVPISEWADYESYSDAMADGAAGVIFPGRAEYFIISSGTSGNKPKRIPESKSGEAAKHMVTRLRLMQMARQFPGIAQSGAIFPLSNSSPLGTTSAGIPCGYASGFTLSQSLSGGQIVRMAYPTALAAVTDPASRDYLMMRFAIQTKDVAILAGNNAGRFAELAALAVRRSSDIIRDIRLGTISGSVNCPSETRQALGDGLLPDPQRADELQAMVDRNATLLPRNYWPGLRLALFWLSSSVGQYIKDIRQLLPPDSRFVDVGYGASEGKFNIPLLPDQAAGVLSLCTAFYEFIPLDGGQPLLAHQLQDQQSYELVLTNWSGLYRYNMKDIVKVDGFTGTTPNIVFQSKSGEILNITEERLPAALVSDIIRTVAARSDVDVVQVQIFPDEDDRQYYCYVETSATSAALDTIHIAAQVHQKLGTEHQLYDLLCVQQQLMKPLKIIQMKNGWQNHLYQEKTGQGVSSTQIKLPVMIKNKPDSGWIK